MSTDQILIVGAGPTGLVLAQSLARRGVPFRIIDRNPDPGQASRAMAVQARTLELYSQLGFADEMVSRGIKMGTLHVREGGKEFARLILGNLGEGLSPYPFILSFPQDEHERFLTQELQSLSRSFFRGRITSRILRAGACPAWRHLATRCLAEMRRRCGPPHHA